MKATEIPFEDLIGLQENQEVPGIYDVEMRGIERLRAYDRVECHVVLYPYSRRITSDDIALYPFEEYVKDVLSHQRSAYAEILQTFNEVFGLLLGVVIALIFALLKPEELLSVESIVSVFAAYTIGKELWDDIERALVNVTKGWRIRFQESDYRYRLEKHTTLTLYSYLAKKQRYGKATLLPERIDFIKQSNSQTLRMCFDVSDLRSFAEPSVHIHSIHVDPALQGEYEQGGYLFGVKLGLSKTALGISRNLELFQSVDKGVKGCLDEAGNWIEGALFYRHTYTLGRIKGYAKKGIIPGQSIVRA
ncbi:MAG: hypothetical protein ISS56_18980 [Anaerolineae bacterium]|nr:hypothetical protein [Anaerolineae bacterium]